MEGAPESWADRRPHTLRKMIPGRIILSRKGFDASLGRRASPIFDDETMVSIPIPEGPNSPEGPNLRVKYDDIVGKDGHSLGPFVFDSKDLLPVQREGCGQQLGRSTVLNSLARCANFSWGSTKPPVRCPMLVSCIGGSVN